MVEIGHVGRVDMGPYALQLIGPNCIVEPYKQGFGHKEVWHSICAQKVPVTALNSGFIVFEFDKASDYLGGAVPSLPLEADKKIPKAVSDAEAERYRISYGRLTYMNAFLFCYQSGLSIVSHRGHPIQEPIEPTNYFIATKQDSRWLVFQDASRGQFVELKPGDFDLEIGVLEYSKNLFSDLFERYGAKSIELMSLIYLACYQYRKHQFSSAHLIAWSAVEFLLNDLWESHLGDLDSSGRTVVNKTRKEILTGRDYTAAIVTQILSVSGIIDDELVERFDSARRKRNHFAHKLSAISGTEAGAVIRLATDMLSTHSSDKVTSHLSLSFWV